MTGREQLPARRFHRSIEIEHDGLRYTAGIGFYDDGRPGEVFLTCGKGGSLAETNARDCAILVSLLLQLGVSIDTLQHMITPDRRRARSARRRALRKLKNPAGLPGFDRA